MKAIRDLCWDSFIWRFLESTGMFTCERTFSRNFLRRGGDDLILMFMLGKVYNHSLIADGKVWKKLKMSNENVFSSLIDFKL